MTFKDKDTDTREENSLSTETEEKRFPVPDVSDVEMAFPASVLDWMPSREEIPDEFRFMRGKSEWSEIVSQWFFQGLPEDAEFYPAEGVDPEKALRAIKAILGSYAPKHEHKEEAAAYLLSQWFTKVKKWRKK